MGEINIGKTIASCRRSEGITQEELAEYLGVTKAAVSKWELGINLPDITLIPKVAAFFVSQLMNCLTGIRNYLASR